jgi:hypothetical protein
MADIIVILTAHRRSHSICLIADAIRHQTVAAREIWFYANDPSPTVADAIALARADRVVASSVNTYFHGRFALALTAVAEYVAIFDDDSIPGPHWFENCLATMERTPGILGTAGVRLHDHSYATATKHGWHEPRIETVAVDLVGHAWFLRTEWIHYLFAERATLGTNGEDIELAARAMRMAGIPCYCPPHPPRDMSFWGSTRGDEFGNDEHASFRRSDHVPERDHIVRSEIAKGWRPLFMQGNSTGGVGPEPAMPERQAAGTQKCNLEKPEAPEIDRKPVPTDAGRKTQNDNAEDLSDASVGALVALVPQSAQRVLHIGDARSKVLERPEDSRQLTVVEVEPPQLLLAIARATKETIEPETTDGMWQGPFGTFDAIVCEVFDYFRDSMQVLAFVRERLNPHGTLVLRVPNARHHSIIEGLIEGEPPGPVAGTDQTANGRPKRVFTRREIEKLLFRGWFHV